MMVFLVIVVLLILFILADLAIRNLIRYYKTKREKQERAKILDESLNIDFTSEAKTLKRVEVENPKAKILCVDDEEVILDSFRKILVLDGYSIDTVENGKEALGLIQRNHYDFVFTDLKMPEMTGEEVTRGVKHLRPDIDVVIITGYATVESAVECMQYGAMDYLQKPFTEEELLAKVKEFLIKRKEKIKASLKPSVNIISFENGPETDEKDFSIPGGVFISKGHVWLSVEQPGNVKIGLDDFAKKVIGKIDGIEFPNLGMEINPGQNLFNIKVGQKKISFTSPITGKVIKVNKILEEDLDVLDITSYSSNWICEIDSDKLDSELKTLKIGKSAVNFYRDEIDNLSYQIKEILTDKGVEVKKQDLMTLLDSLKEQELEKIFKVFFNRG